MRLIQFLRSVAALALGALASGATHAAQTSASAYASVQGYDAVTQSVTSAGSLISATAARDGQLGTGDVFTFAVASSRPGFLRASASSRGATTGSPATDIGASASASWSDSFVITSAGRSGQTGTWTGSVQVDGGMATEFAGRAYVHSSVSAGVDIFPGTGYNGGRTVVGGGAWVDMGYDIAPRRLGNPSDALTLNLAVPFTFGQNIDVSLSLSTNASGRLLGGFVGLIDSGSARSLSDYAHSMTWGGISKVLDNDGIAVLGYSALSPTTNFDFATAVPEPNPSAMLLAGLMVGTIVTRLRRLSLRFQEAVAAAG